MIRTSSKNKTELVQIRSLETTNYMSTNRGGGSEATSAPIGHVARQGEMAITKINLNFLHTPQLRTSSILLLQLLLLQLEFVNKFVNKFEIKLICVGKREGPTVSFHDLPGIRHENRAPTFRWLWRVKGGALLGGHTVWPEHLLKTKLNLFNQD